MRVIDLIRRLREEFAALPGLRLTTAQVERLWTTDALTSASALNALVSAGFLTPLPGGSYGRTELAAGVPSEPSVAAHGRTMPSPWQRILCLVDVDDDSGNALSSAARSALRYATTLAVTNRARVTALQVISQPTSALVLTSSTDALRKSVAGEPFRGLIDVRVSTGAPNGVVAQVAKDIHADLIVIGRNGTGSGKLLSRLSETVRQAPCPVLIVHPSGRAAVA